jgi:hypothetical protein
VHQECRLTLRATANPGSVRAVSESPSTVVRFVPTGTDGARFNNVAKTLSVGSL